MARLLPQGPGDRVALIAAGADPNYRDSEPGSETPLHWAASSDDVDVAAALIDGGADIEAPDGSIGTPLDNAIGYGCWHVARLLVARGARVEKLWHAGALGLLDRLEELLETASPTMEDVSQGFWHACAGGQRRAAERLLAAGADLNWVPDYASGTPLDAASGLAPARRTSSDGSKRKEPSPPTTAPLDAQAYGDRRPPVKAYITLGRPGRVSVQGRFRRTGDIPEHWRTWVSCRQGISKRRTSSVTPPARWLPSTTPVAPA